MQQASCCASDIGVVLGAQRDGCGFAQPRAVRPGAARSASLRPQPEVPTWDVNLAARNYSAL